jgi:TruD family tRNA pseudouridine synthase
LRISEKDISYAGTKDAKAEIIQHFSIKNISKDLIKFFENEKLFKILTEEVAFRHLQLGDLTGNKFKIKIKVDEKTKLEENKNLPEFFSNYFGLQRFGVKHHKLLEISEAENLNYFRRSMPINGVLLMIGNYRQGLVLKDAWIFSRETSELV